VSDATIPGPSRAWHRLKALGFASPLYRLTLGSRAPERLVAMPADPWPGDEARGNAMFQGRFRFAGREAQAPNQPPWRLRPGDAAWTRALHGFEWLGDFAAVEAGAAGQHARRLVRSWIELCGEWEPEYWEPELLARRLVAWTGHAGFLLDGADEPFRHQFLASLDRQLRHLGRAAGGVASGRPSVTVALALVSGGLALPDGGAKAERGMRLLQRELASGVAPDGGHPSRSPSLQMAVLRDFVRFRECLLAASREVPNELQNAIDRMAPMLRAFCHGDGGLALFNGGFEEEAEAVAATLDRSGAEGRALNNAPHSGFQRLVAGRSIVVMDTGSQVSAALAPGAHAGAQSFEFSRGRHRVVVNCGSGQGRDPEWHAAMRVSAAHSTLIVDDTNNAELPAPGRAGRSPAGQVERNEDEAGNIWVESTHDGYRQDFGLRHRRRLYLDASGEDLRGEDRLLAELAEARERPFNIRFHLHPAIQASLVQAGAQALLRLPSGEGWRFRASGGEVGLEESVYLGRRDELRRTEQIVVRTDAEGATTVKWAFRKV
jgi:uncharacterized heparinase superfamily protein